MYTISSETCDVQEKTEIKTFKNALKTCAPKLSALPSVRVLDFTLKLKPDCAVVTRSLQ